MIGLLLAAMAGAGVYLLYTGMVLGWTGLHITPTPDDRQRRVAAWAGGSGLDTSSLREIAATTLLLAVVGLLVGFAVFGGPLPAVAIALFAASFPAASRRTRHLRRRAAAMDAWPRLLEELRIQTSSMGRSVPQALFDVGRTAPVEMRSAFSAAQREWLLSTDFARTVAVLKVGLADPTADAACETLLVAHEVGGTDLDRRLEALIDDRIQDTQGRKDARARQAGVRFARRFVILVPAGMALAGMSVGTGRSSYESGSGQALVVVAIVLVVVCWVWAGRIMTLPEERRVFDG